MSKLLIVPCEQAEKPEKTPVSIRIQIFFDGTQNNRTNVLDTTKSDEFKAKHGSYTNDLSNIAKLEYIIKEDKNVDFSISLYIEGIGTEDLKEDVNRGLAFGTGATGVKGKAEKGIEKIHQNIRKAVPDKTTPIEYVYLDLFGFSRGAAAARYCTHMILDGGDRIPLKDWLNKEGYKTGPVKVKFMGLFDTVASLGVKHSNDTSDLSLDSVQYAEKGIQIAAAEEHRKNFRLTNINSVGSRGKQIFLPGVHSDIGGSYPDNYSEDLIVFTGDLGSKRVKNEIKWLTEQGWYDEEEISLVHRGGPNGKMFADIYVKRSGIKNGYSHIPLHLMVDFAEQDLVIFDKEALDDKYAIPEELTWLKEEIYEKRDTVLSSEVQINGWWRDKREKLKRVRHEFFHFSAYYGAPGAAFDPEFIDGKRKRKIQDG